MYNIAMKNWVIGFLVIGIVVLGYFAFFSSEADAPTNQSVQEQSTQVATSSGKTLLLANQGLSDLDTGMFDDKSVVILDVSGNNLTGALPSEIGKMSNLEELYAQDNDFTGIPAEIGQLSKLRVISFANNNITGLPLELGNLSNLETLDLRGNPDVSTYDIGLIQPKIPQAQILTD